MRLASEQRLDMLPNSLEELGFGTYLACARVGRFIPSCQAMPRRGQAS